MTTLAEALRELLKYPFDTRGKWSPVWANAREALAANDAQQAPERVSLCYCPMCKAVRKTKAVDPCDECGYEGDMKPEAQQQEPDAWMRDDGEEGSISTMTVCVSKKVKDLWLRANPRQVERYTIPLYTHPPQDAKDAVPTQEQQWSMMDKAFVDKFKAGGYQYGTDEKQDANSWFRFGYFAAMEAKK
jgi:hypothetical protein